MKWGRVGVELGLNLFASVFLSLFFYIVYRAELKKKKKKLLIFSPISFFAIFLFFIHLFFSFLMSAIVTESGPFVLICYQDILVAN